MRLCRTLLALFTLVPAGSGAEIFPLKGDPIKGEIVSVSNTDVVFKQGDKQVTKPLKEVVKIEYREVGKPEAATTYTQVELTDGTQLLASKWSIKKREVELTLLAGPVVKLPLDVVSNILSHANVEAHRRNWKSRVLNARGREALVVKREDVISSIECTLGDGSETGQEITLAVTIDGETRTLKRKLSNLHGLIFKHVLPTKAPPVTCKVFDTLQDVVMVSSLASTATGLSVTTPSGAKIDFTNAQIARLDYSKGRFEYLSDLTPLKVVAKSSLDDDPDKPDQWHVYKDVSLAEKKMLSLGGVGYSKGLALKPYVEVTYDLKGEFRELSLVIGIDDNVERRRGVDHGVRARRQGAGHREDLAGRQEALQGADPQRQGRAAVEDHRQERRRLRYGPASGPGGRQGEQVAERMRCSIDIRFPGGGLVWRWRRWRRPC